MDDVSAPADYIPTSMTGSGQIVAAINPKESHWFLKQIRNYTGKRTGFSLLDLADRGWNETAGELRELNPEVLLTCWSTPLLPDGWLESKECRLRYICHLTGSVRHVVSRRFIERGGLISNWGSIPAPAVAEHALLLALAALRNLPAWPRIFAEPSLTANRMESLQVRTLAGRRVGIHGLGQVAQALVKLLMPFGTSISAYSAGVPQEMYARAGVRRASSLHELFATNDVVFECEALNPHTQGTVQGSELAAMPDGGVLVNVPRAGLINEEALFQEAKKGRIRLALDVFAEEPLPPDSPWLKIPGLVLSPHIAGPTYDQYSLCAEVALANIERYLRGEPLESVVTLEIYDRST